jgi:hypothetical protein
VSSPARRTLGQKPRPAAPPATPAPAAGPAAVETTSWKPALGRDDNPGFVDPGGVIILPSEKEELRRRFGWQEGDPLPANLAELVAAARREAEALRADALEPTLPVPPDTPPTKAPEPLEADELPPAKRREIAAALALAKQQAAELREAESLRPAQAPPGVADAIAAGLATPQTPQTPPRATPPQAPPPPEPLGHAAHAGHAESATGAGRLHECPFCGWDQARAVEGEVTDQDRDAFRAVFFLPGQRFRKEYRLLRGALTVRFRGLTVAEESLAKRQIMADAVRDQEAKTARAPADYEADFLLYLTCLALEYVAGQAPGAPGGDELTVPPLADWDAAALAVEAPDTPLKAYAAQVVAAAMPVESARRVFVQTYSRFQLLLRRLEAESADPNS